MFHRFKKIKIVFIFIFFVLTSSIYADSLNLKKNFFESNKSCENFNFLIAGHIYGNYKNLNSIYPASSFMANIDFMNKLKPEFMVLLGDSYRETTDIYIEAFKKSILNKVQMPIYSVIGNHEAENRETYQRIFGEPFYSFSKCKNLFIFLDTEQTENSHFSDKQLNFFKDELKKANFFDNIFIFSHKLIWASRDNNYSPVWHSMNIRGRNSDYEFYSLNVKPFIEKASKGSDVFFISGDIGLLSPETIFFNQENKFTFIATGLGDRPDDNIILVSVSDENSVDLKALSLFDQKMRDLSSFDFSKWIVKKNNSNNTFFNLFNLLVKALVVLFIGFIFGFYTKTFLIRRKISSKDDN